MKTTMRQEHVSEIMGKNFFGSKDWTIFYGANFRERLSQIPEFPWGEDILTSTCPLCGKKVKDCHFAFLGHKYLNGEPLTIHEFQKIHPVDTPPQFYKYEFDMWYSEEKFAAETTMELRWYLLHLKNVSSLTDKTYTEQETMLPAEYEVPSAVVEFAKNLLFFKKNRIRPNSSSIFSWRAWCKDVSDASSDNVAVYFYYDRADILIIYHYDGNESYIQNRVEFYEITSVAASRKFF